MRIARETVHGYNTMGTWSSKVETKTRQVAHCSDLRAQSRGFLRAHSRTDLGRGLGAGRAGLGSACIIKLAIGRAMWNEGKMLF